MRRNPQAIAMSLRFYLYASEAGAKCNTYPHGPARPVLVEYSEAERIEHARKRDELLAEWRDVDPEGYRQWRTATDELSKGQAEPLTGWAALIHVEDGIRLVDPCAYCRECRR